MEVAAKLGTSLALSALSPLLNKLSSRIGGDVTDEEMQHLNRFVRYEILALTRKTKSDDLVQSIPLLEDLQAAALELEDLLDLYEYNQIEKQVNSSSYSNCIKEFRCIYIDWLKPILPKSPLRIRLENLMKCVKQVENIYPFIKSNDITQPQANTVRPKTSTLSSPFYGRADQCDMIIKLLLDESHSDLNSRTKNVRIIAIRGLGGAGKTTTAQHVYNDNKIVNYFDLRMWVHVTRGFDERRLITETIESATKEACPVVSNLDVLQTKLKDLVSEKKFLLVFDDVWEIDTKRLDILLSPLNQVGVKGSMIIVTTRTEKAANDWTAKPIILLDELKDEDCWSILKHYAFDDNEEIIENHQELKYVGNLIISKVKHSALALKVVGSSLRDKRSANEWDNILQQEDILKDTMDLLLFSYQCLPLHVQQCFAYCSLFPKGHKFYFDDQKTLEPNLISLWIAQGFIENTTKLTLEEAGKKYIEELVSYSFFEKKNAEVYGDYFVIHDLLHDLAEKVSKKQCHRIEHYDSLHVPTTCIHLSLFVTDNLLSVDMSNIVEIFDIFKLRNLRSLIILQGGGFENIFKSNKDIFRNLTKLRAMHVSDNKQTGALSDPHIDELKHLRYLHVEYDSKLPISLTKLYQLQFLLLYTNMVDSGEYLPADTLPQGFGNLFNLRTLKFYRTHRSLELDYLYYNSKMINIEKLTSLQNLNFFYVDGFNGMISLRNLPLVKSLSILNLENVKCKEEAEEAMLIKKKNLNGLMFKWSSTPSSIDTCMEVLEGLKPHRNLVLLRIEGYQSVRFPNWMVKENGLPRLQTLSLKSCTSLKTVPFLPPHLQSLEVENCHELMQLPPFGDTLRILSLSKCPKLMPPSMLNESPGLSDLSFLTNLEKLDLTGIPNFQALTNLSPTVIHLHIEDCPKLTSLGNMQRCTSLKYLNIYKCPMLRREEASLVEGVVEGDITSGLPQVEFISTDDPFLVFELVQRQAFGSIKFLDLRGLRRPFLHMSDEYFHQIPSLPELRLTDCAALPNLEMLSSLQTLIVFYCPDVESLPKLPVSLQLLEVFRCPKLKEKYEEGGPLRNTISHIPRILIR